MRVRILTRPEDTRTLRAITASARAEVRRRRTVVNRLSAKSGTKLVRVGDPVTIEEQDLGVKAVRRGGRTELVTVVPGLAAEGFVEVRPAGKETLRQGELVIVGKSEGAKNSAGVGP